MCRKLLTLILVLLLASVCFAPWRITNKNVSNPKLLTRLLQDRIGTIDDQITTLQAASTSGLYENIGTGDVFYVDSVTGSDSDTGATWALAKATLDAAVALCSAGNNDVIYVASGHTETLAVDVSLDVDGITVIGTGNGINAPSFTFDTTTDEFIVDGNNITVYNLRFIPGVADVATGIDVQDGGSHFTLMSCEFVEPATNTYDFTVGIVLVTAADNVTIAYNTFNNIGANPGTTTFLELGAAAINSLSVVGNVINADMSVAAIFSDKADTDLFIVGNSITQEDVDKPCISLTSTATGLIADNIFCNLGGTAYIMDPGSCHLVGNRANYAIDTGSVPWPEPTAEGRLTGTGNVYYVDASSPGAGDGRSWWTAVTTIDAGINLCTADRGDTIYVAAGHTETKSGSGMIFDADVAGVTIIGQGVGENRPIINFGHVDANTVIGADDVSIENITFFATVTAVKTALLIEGGAENFIVKDCIFEFQTTTTDEFIDAITTIDGTDGGTIQDCRFLGDIGSNAGPKSSINFVGSDYIRIIGNEFFGDMGDAHIFNETTAANFVVIKDNLVFNGIIGGNTGLNTVAGISLVSTTTGIIVDNTVVCNVASPDLAIVAADCYLAGNTYSEDESTAGSFPIGTMGGSGIRWVSVDLASIATPTNNLFAVTGGPIKLLDIVTYVTSTLETTASLCNYNVDPTNPATDTAFGTDGTALDWTGAATGSLFWWDGVLATDLAKITNGVGIGAGTDVSHGLYIPIGMIELTTTATMTGTVTVYMSYVPMSSKSMVIPQ